MPEPTNKPNQRLSPVPIRLTEEERELIEQAAKANGRTRSGFMRHASLTTAAQVLGMPVSQCITGGPAHASGQA